MCHFVWCLFPWKKCWILTCHVPSFLSMQTHSYFGQLLQALAVSLFPPRSWNSFIFRHECWTLTTAKLSEWVVDEARKDPRVPCSKMPRCHQHQSWPLSFPWWMLCMDLCRNPQGSSLTVPETWRISFILTNTYTHTLKALFPLLWQRVVGWSAVMEGVKAQHSDRDSLRGTLLLSFPVVVETCWDFLSNKARTHQSTLANIQSVETTHLIHRSAWVHAVVQKILPREQLLGLNPAVSPCFCRKLLP